LEFGPNLKEGDEVVVSGGYDPSPEWLNGESGYSGELIRFIPGQNEQPAAVIHTHNPVEVQGVRGRYLVLELRYTGASWQSGQVVHIELCDFEPPAIRWQERRQGAWVESHATIEVISA
jgi:hypothetical protein